MFMNLRERIMIVLLKEPSERQGFKEVNNGFPEPCPWDLRGVRSLAEIFIPCLTRKTTLVSERGHVSLL